VGASPEGRLRAAGASRRNTKFTKDTKLTKGRTSQASQAPDDYPGAQGAPFVSLVSFVVFVLNLLKIARPQAQQIEPRRSPRYAERRPQISAGLASAIGIEAIFIRAALASVIGVKAIAPCTRPIFTPMPIAATLSAGAVNS
jgi:hypothetical protein